MPQQNQQHNQTKAETASISTIKDTVFKWLLGVLGVLITVIGTDIKQSIKTLDEKVEALIIQSHTNNIDIEVLKNKIQNIEKAHTVNYPLSSSMKLTLFKPEEEYNFKSKTKKNEI